MLKQMKDAAVHFRLPSEVLAELEKIATDRKVKVSVVIRAALETYVKGVKDVERI